MSHRNGNAHLPSPAPSASRARATDADADADADVAAPPSPRPQGNGSSSSGAATASSAPDAPARGRLTISEEDLARAQAPKWTYCPVCQVEALLPHARPYYRGSDQEEALQHYLEDRWDCWGAAGLLLECGSYTVVAAIEDALLQLHKKQAIRGVAGYICAAARRMALARRRRPREQR